MVWVDSLAQGGERYCYICIALVPLPHYLPYSLSGWFDWGVGCCGLVLRIGFSELTGG